MAQSRLDDSPIDSVAPSPITSATPSIATIIAPSPIKPVTVVKEVTEQSSKLRWSAKAPVFVPKATVEPKEELSLKKSPLPTSQEFLTATKSPAETVVPLEPPKSEWADEQDDTPAAVDDWYEDDTPEYSERDREDRTVMIRGISPFTTLADLAGIIRGGIVLNMHIRSRDQAAIVSFVDPLAAEKFIMHSRRNDIYLKGKRLDVTWSDYQQQMHAHIDRQVRTNGATRNIVIRFAKKEMTEQTIRKDLEHIHKLEIVNIVTANNHIFISTNAINFAMSARQCMRSRLMYKGTRIEFFEDECDQVLPVVEKKIWKKQSNNSSRPATVSMANRFALLFESEDGSTGGARIEQAPQRSISASDVKTLA